MSVTIPINASEMPMLSPSRMAEYKQRVAEYAKSLWMVMAEEPCGAPSRRSTLIADDRLESLLADRPEYASASHDDMSQLTQADYRHYAKKHHVMKGIEKWL